MSLTVPQKPAKYAPAYNQMIYIAKDLTNASQPNFRYICTILVGGVAQAVIKQFPEPDGYGVFDIHRVVENYVSYDCAIDGTTGGGFNENVNSYVVYQTVFGEEYGVIGSTGYVSSTGLVTDSARYAWNGIMDFPDYHSFLAGGDTPFLLQTPFPGQWLTNSPNPKKIRLGTKDWLHFMTDTDPTNWYSKLTIYKNDGTNSSQTWVVSVSCSPWAGFDDNAHFLRVRSGPQNLEGFIDATTLSYTIQMFNGSNVAVSSLFTYTLVDTLPKYPYYRLHFLNKLGGFDSFDFGKVSKKTTDTIQRQKYQKLIGSEVGGSWGFGLADQVNANFDIQTRQLVTLRADWITDAESVWLQELLTSPVVFLEVDSQTLISVTIESTSYEQQQKINNKVIFPTIDISYGYDLTRQRQ